MTPRPGAVAARRGAALAIALGAMSPATAWAQAFQGHAGATLGLGYNAVQADAATPAGTVIPSGPVLAFAPTASFTYDRPRVEQSLEYDFTLNLQFNKDFSLDSDLVTYANRVVYQARVYVAPTVDLLTGFTLTELPLNAAAAVGEAGQAPVSSTPVSGYTVQGVGTEGLVKHLSETLDLTQSAAVSLGIPVNSNPIEARTYAGTLGLAVAKTWNMDTGTLTGTSTVAHFTEGTDPVSAKPEAPFNQVINTVVVGWRREFTERLGLEIDGGVIQSFDPADTGGMFWQPTAAVTVDYVHRVFAAELAYAHAATLNLYLAQIQLIDEAAFRLSVPVDRHRDITASTTAAYERARAIAIDGSLVNPTDLWMADAGVAWIPHRAPNLALGARVSVQRQEPIGAALIPGFTRETVLATVTYGYPAALTAQPAYVSPIYRAAPVNTRDVEAADLRAHPDAPHGTEDEANGPAEPAAPAKP